MIKPIGAFLGRLFGSEKALESVAKGIDKLVYTAEEKAEDTAKDRSEARKMLIEWLKATSGQNLARRILALSITFVWLLDFIIAQVCAFFTIINGDFEKAGQLAEMFKDFAGLMDAPVMLLLGFYFAAPHLDKIVPVFTQKFGVKK